jgi:signal transduction histidine kinase/ligand-binding sensor domain-containing protein
LRNSNTFPDRVIQSNRLIRWLAAALTGICFTNLASALDSTKALSQYVHDSWGSDRGFLGGVVYAIGQSADGYLWIGTERGLVRFDGSSFTLMQRPVPDSPPIGPVRGLVSDGEGNLWIRLEGQRMLRYREGRFEDVFTRFDLEETTFTASALDIEGRVLLSGLGNHTLRYSHGSFETIANGEEVPGTAISIAETRDGRIWMGTRDDGLFCIDAGRVSSPAAELANAKINTLIPANNGGLWIGTDNGILLWDGSELLPTGLPPANRVQTLAMTKDPEGNVWAGTALGLLRITPTGTVSFYRRSQGGEVTAVYIDRDGALWFGGSQGIERLRDGLFATYSTAQGLSSDSNGPVFVDSGGRTWFAPLTGGLYWLKDDQIREVPAAGLHDDVVYSITGGEDEVWIGRQRGGLTLLTQRGRSFAARSYTQAEGLPENSVYSVHRNRDGTVWAGTVSGGASRLRNGTFTNYSVADGLASNAINSIVEGYDGKMWFATPSGLASFAEGKWRKLSASEGLPSSDVRSIFEDSKHILWVATSGGLAYLSSGRVGVPHGLPESLREQVFGITEDRRGFLWISTSDHMLRVNRDHLLAGSLADSDVRSYGIADGLQGIEGVRRDRSMVADSLGRVWVSLNHGLAVADPTLTVNQSPPVQVRIESMSAGGAQVNLQDSPKIAAGSQGLAINFAATTLSSLERIRFRYRLDGSDRGWSGAVASRQVNYTNLGPGTYRFHIIASNGEGLWNGPETTVSFVIEPAFWQTWGFQVSCVAAFTLALIALYRLRLYQLTRQLNLRFQERLAERTRIAQELHDTLLQGFLSASLQLDVAEDQLPDDSPTKPMLQRVLQLMAQVIEEGRNALHGLRASQNNDRDLEMAFSRMREELVVDGKISYRVIVRNETRSVRPLIRDEVYRIGREALVNAFRHSHANNIELEVEYASKYLRILVRDDGRGMDDLVLQSGRKGHWGLPGMRERSESIGASLRLRSRIGAGTEVELTVPGTIAFESQPHGSLSRWLSWFNRE